MQSRVFISRELTSESEFLQLMQLSGYEVIGESLIEFRGIPFSNLPEVDWVFFYSKTAVRFFFDNLRKANLKLNARLAAFGKGTATALQEKGYQADFIGIGDPEQNATYFEFLSKGQRVLFPRAAHSRLSIQKRLKDQIEIIDLILYENQPRTNLEIPVCDWLVFTSPMNVQAYIAKYEIKPDQQIVAIGKTTAAALQQMGMNNVTIAEEPSELALAQAIKNATPL